MINLLRDLGYQESTLLSFIRKKENIKLKSEHDFNYTKGKSVYFTLYAYKIKLTELLKEDPEMKDLENLYTKGYNYSIAKRDPSIQDVWEDLIKNRANKKYINKLSIKIKYLEGANKLEVIGIVNSIFTKIAYGSILPEHIQQLERIINIVGKNKEYFEIKYSEKEFNDDFLKDVDYLEILNSFGYDANFKLSQLEKKENQINSLNNSFLKIKTPDKQKTLEDRIEGIKTKIKSQLSVITEKEENLYLQGYLIAIRGEDPHLIQVINNNARYVRSDYDAMRFYNKDYFGNDPKQNIHNILAMVLEGYALSYHLKFLEDYKQKIATPVINEKLSSDNFKIKIKWRGQKNQLYDILRQLKAKEIIGNSYEDLALFLKENVDIFKDTALSTIQKEIGKNKRPTKIKRVDVTL